MLNPTSLLADALGRNLAETYRRIYADREPHIASALDEAARLVIERIASSDALYHNCEHTALVILCVQDILRGRRLEQTITPSDWGHTILAALNHDIGYVRGICAGDTAEHFVIDAAGKWVMPGLIDAHCHMSYGYPLIKGEGKGKGTTRPEFSTLKSARSAQKVLRSGVTSISVPGGTWFTDVGVRDAIKLGLMEGPRMFVAGRMIVTYGCIEDDEPSWEGTPDHSIGKLCNTADEMVTEVRRQGKHGVNFIKMADSRSGESQMLARDEIAAVVGEAHRRNLKVAIHSRGAGSTRAAAEAGVDWIVHADLATDRDLDAVAKAGMPILPTATFLAVVVELGKPIAMEEGLRFAIREGGRTVASGRVTKILK